LKEIQEERKRKNEECGKQNIFSSTKNKEETFCPYNKTSPSIKEEKCLFKVK
jgi:hypothetical protein